METISSITGSAGLVDSSAFYDEAVYQRELEVIFKRSWLFVGHESMIPRPGDFRTTYMGDDAVIVCRDKESGVRVLLNKCRHRGNKVCQFDKGNANIFRCSYHGWSYDTAGQLRGVPLAESAYGPQFDKSSMGLVSPRVATYKGLIFACWDHSAPPLTEYLGEGLLWYLDNFLLDSDPNGLQVVPGLHRYLMPVNWKLLAENFGGDQYHFAATHGSVAALSKAGRTARIDFSIDEGQHYSVVLDGGAPHGLLQLAVGKNFYQDDLAQAETLGAEAVHWLTERQRLQDERLAAYSVQPYSFHVANIFPNFSMIGMGTAFYGRGFIMWQPRGPRLTEVWEWCLVESSAPRSVKERMVFVLSQRQSAAGLVTPDDHENFERLSDALETGIAREVPFNYSLGEDVEPVESLIAELPGNVRPQVSETYQREFYRHWHRTMTEPA
ncbi:aromatic ring-hydroxylating dioxygenase subunit alpha [Mycolicibacterium moriokaense]|nr:aromatic ring-hydroxylating dioxygenase subunit alpha [Mycolicibacterium moriokaense]